MNNEHYSILSVMSEPENFSGFGILCCWNIVCILCPMLATEMGHPKCHNFYSRLFRPTPLYKVYRPTFLGSETGVSQSTAFIIKHHKLTISQACLMSVMQTYISWPVHLHIIFSVDDQKSILTCPVFDLTFRHG